MGIEEKLAKAKSMLMMCLGNTCRSPAAEGFARKFSRDFFKAADLKEINIASAGLNDYFSHAQPYSVQFVKELEGESINNHVPRRITKEIADKFDIIIIMEEYMKDRIQNCFPSIKGLKNKIFLLKEACINEMNSKSLEIEDPYMSDKKYYFNIIKEIRDYTKCLVRKWASNFKKEE
ncbi:MAG: hypothetical protein ACFFCS_21680 [Candidatus Hodarchaeota archaeon]